MSPDESRRALREQMRTRRESLAPAARLEAASAVASHLRTLPALARARSVAGYWAVRGELPLHALLSPRPAFTYLLPCLCDAGTLRFAPWQTGMALTPNRYGIPEPERAKDSAIEPENLDLVLVPLLAFDAGGQRLGSGAGYYDRSFSFLQGQTRPTRPLLVGVGYAFQQVEALDAQSWDVALDWIATDAGLLRCGS